MTGIVNLVKILKNYFRPVGRKELIKYPFKCQHISKCHNRFTEQGLNY